MRVAIYTVAALISAFSLGAMAGAMHHHTYAEAGEWELIAEEDPEETCTFIEGESVIVGVGV